MCSSTETSTRFTHLVHVSHIPRTVAKYVHVVPLAVHFVPYLTGTRVWNGKLASLVYCSAVTSVNACCDDSCHTAPGVGGVVGWHTEPKAGSFLQQNSLCHQTSNDARYCKHTLWVTNGCRARPEKAWILGVEIIDESTSSFFFLSFFLPIRFLSLHSVRNNYSLLQRSISLSQKVITEKKCHFNQSCLRHPPFQLLKKKNIL